MAEDKGQMTDDIEKSAETQAEQTAVQEQTSETHTAEQPTETPTKPEAEKPVNLMDDDEEEQSVEDRGKKVDGDGEPEADKEPTEDERTAFVDAVKKIDIGEGVKWDDPALVAMAPSLMSITGGDAKKAERLIKDYTSHVQANIRAAQEANDKFLNGLVAQCYERFGGKEGVKRTCALAKAGGLHVFGEKLWRVMREERAFANNPDIIERLAAIGRTVTDDPGVVKKENPAAGAKRDWRESMYGGKR